MYVERGTKELVCAKKEMGLREEEEREIFFFFFLIQVLVLGEKGILFLCLAGDLSYDLLIYD